MQILFSILVTMICFFPRPRLFAANQNIDSQMAAASCGKVDLAHELGPKRNQGSNNNCYAQVAADMLTQYARSQNANLEKDGFQASALQLQFAENRRRGHFPTQGYGFTEHAIKAVVTQGGKLCSNGLSESGEAESSDLSSPDLVQIQTLANQSVLDSKDYVNRTPYADRIAKRLFKNCPATLEKMPKLQSWYYDLTKQNDEDVRLKQLDIDVALNQGRISGIALDSKWLNGKPGAHAVSVVARQYYNGQCWYAIRNSWGPNCDGLIEKIRKECVNGYIWMTASDLMPKVMETITISPKENRSATSGGSGEKSGSRR